MYVAREKKTGVSGERGRHARIGTIPEAIADLKSGKLIVLVDDASRENEGDLVFPAERVTPEIINFYETHARGWICVPMAPAEVDRLELPLMVNANTERHGTAFTVTVDAASGTTTGISAADQSLTIRSLADPETQPADLLRPGHVRPIRARAGGVLERAGHTEAVVDLMRLAGFRTVGVLCEIKNADGSMARLPQLVEYAESHDLRIYTIEDLIAYRLLSERLVTRDAEADVRTRWGLFRAIGYSSVVREEEHLALVYGDLSRMAAGEEPALVRVHVSHVLCDLFAVPHEAGFDRVDAAMRRIVDHGSGVLVYIRSRLRGRRMLAQLKEMSERSATAIREEDEALPPDQAKRDYGLGAQIIRDLGLSRIRVLTDHPMELVGMAGYGIEVLGHLPLGESGED